MLSLLRDQQQVREHLDQLAQNKAYNQQVLGRRSFGNPSILDKVVAAFNVDERALREDKRKRKNKEQGVQVCEEIHAADRDVDHTQNLLAILMRVLAERERDAKKSEK